MGFIGGAVVKIRLPMQEMQEIPVQFLGQEDPLESETADHSSILTWKIPMDRGAWWAMVHGITNSGTKLSAHAH